MWRALASLLIQSDKNWTCFIQDDNSVDTLGLLREIDDPRFIIRLHNTNATERINSTRYSVLINEILPALQSGIVGYLCDNVEYHPELVKTVNTWFEHNPDKFSGYVYHLRDVYSVDGKELRGMASDFGHWNQLPPGTGPVSAPAGLLDHSQVFHRLPVALRWNESPAIKTHGDGDFFTRLAGEYGPIYPVDQANVLTLEHLLEGRI